MRVKKVKNIKILFLNDSAFEAEIERKKRKTRTDWFLDVTYSSLGDGSEKKFLTKGLT